MRKKVNLADKAEAVSLLKQLYGTEQPKLEQDKVLTEKCNQDRGQDKSFVKRKIRSFKDEGQTRRHQPKGNSGSF